MNNVVDFYKYWTTDAIRADLDTKRHDFSIVISNRVHDFNMGTVIRNANAFLAKQVIIFGDKKFDRRATIGTHLYENLKHVKFVEDLDLSGMTIIGVDNVPEAEPIEDFQWPSGPLALVFGEEQVGICDELKALCSRYIYITQYGSVRSLNLGTASGIAMYAMVTNHFRTLQRPPE